MRRHLFLVGRDGWVEYFTESRDLVGFVEAEDVLAGEYVIFDQSGDQLELHGDPPEFEVRPTDRPVPETHAKLTTLRLALKEHSKHRGMAWTPELEALAEADPVLARRRLGP